MKRTWALVAILVVAVIGSVWWLRTDRGPSSTRVETERTLPPSPPPTPSRSVASAAPHAPARVEATPIRLSPATAVRDPKAVHGSLAGRVVDWGTGKGVVGAELLFADDSGAAHSSVSRDAGAFVFEAPAVGGYRLAVVTAEGYLPYAPEWGASPITAQARVGQRIDNLVVYLTPAIEYVGRVVDAEGKPVAGAQVRLFEEPGIERAMAPIADRFESDRDGRFRFHAPDFALFEATHPQHGTGRARLDGPAQISHELTIRLGSAPAPAELRGRVVDEAGEPVLGALVVATPRESDRKQSLRPSVSAQTDDDGEFVAAVEAGSYELVATADGMAAARAVTAAGGEVLTLHLSAQASLRGKVVSARGEPVPAFNVAVLMSEGALERRVVAQRSMVDAEGRFEIGGLAVGPVSLAVMAHGLAPALEVAARAEVGGGTEVLVRLQDGATVFGVVTDGASGQPLELAKVIAESMVSVGASALPSTAAVVTDEQGQFEISGLKSGLSSLLVSAASHHSQLVSGLALEDGARTGPVRVELSPTAPGETPRIELAGIGAVLAAEGDGLRISEVIAEGGAAQAGLVAGDVIVAVDGTAVIEVGFDGALQRIRGPVGSSVRLSVRRGGDTLELVAIRRKIRA